MGVLTSKWAIGALVVLVALVIGSLVSRKDVHTERVIPATPDAIWAVITDAAGYAAWNPVLIHAPTAHVVGATIEYTLREPNGREYPIKAKVLKMDANRELHQRGGIPGVLTFDHQYLLEAVHGGTKVTQHEVYRGIGVWFWNEGWVEPAYASVNEALEARVAALVGS